MHAAIDYMQTWTLRYKGTPLHLPKMMKPKATKLKVCMQNQIWNYEDLPQLITSLQVPMHVYSRVWMMLCAHMQSHLLGQSPK